MDTKIDKHVNPHKPQESGMSTEQYSEALDVWTRKYSDKHRRYEDLRSRLRVAGFSGEQLKILLYELAFFLNLISFETAFEVLRKHREERRYTEVLVNTLGDSLLDGGKQLGQFYEQFETAIEAIGYSPKDLQTFEGVASSDVAGVLRDIIGKLISVKNYGTEQREFVKRMWRAACTLHLTATFRACFRSRELLGRKSLHQCSTKPLTLEAQKSLIQDTECMKVINTSMDITC